MKLTDKQLARTIAIAIKANNEAHMALAAIDLHCEEVYGHSPSDVDADSILDTVYGSSGVSMSISLEEFKQNMTASVALAFPDDE